MYCTTDRPVVNIDHEDTYKTDEQPQEEQATRSIHLLLGAEQILPSANDSTRDQ